MARRNREFVMPLDHLSSDLYATAYDLRAQAIRTRLYVCLWLEPHDEASERLLAFADELETKADAAERAFITPYLMLA